MPTTNTRRITARGIVTAAGETDPWHVTIDITQGRAARTAKGILRIADAATRNVVLDARDFGVLQTAAGWGSVTARARMRGTEEEHPADSRD